MLKGRKPLLFDFIKSFLFKIHIIKFKILIKELIKINLSIPNFYINLFCLSIIFTFGLYNNRKKQGIKLTV